MFVIMLALQRQGLVTGSPSCQNICDGWRLLSAAASNFIICASRHWLLKHRHVAELGSTACASSAVWLLYTRHTAFSDQPRIGCVWQPAQQTVHAEPLSCPSLPAGHEHLPECACRGYGAQAGLQWGGQREAVVQP